MKMKMRSIEHAKIVRVAIIPIAISKRCVFRAFQECIRWMWRPRPVLIVLLENISKLQECHSATVVQLVITEHLTADRALNVQ
jgi:hypothetical protein